MTKSLLCLIAAPLLLAGGTASAIAKTGDDGQVQARVAIVHTHDLALNTVDGRDQLATRITRAARQVCGVRTARGLWESRMAGNCFKQAVDRVQPRLAALLGGDGGALAEHNGRVIVSAP